MKSNHPNPSFGHSDALARPANGQAAYAGDRVLTVEDLSRMFNVSPKTISRWRDHGLEGGRFMIGGRARIGFLESSVNCFARDNPKRVQRGTRFSHLTTAERNKIIELAFQMLRNGQSQSNVVQQAAKRVGRSAETVRYTIENFDVNHPDQGVSVRRTGPLSDATKQQICQQYRHGVSVGTLSERFGHSLSRIRCVISQMRANRVMELPLDYMPSDEFHKLNADDTILVCMPEPDRVPQKARIPSGLPTYLASLFEVPLLSKDQEVHLFRKYNFLKYRASRLRDRLDPVHPKARPLDEIEGLYQQVVETKNQLIRANLRLVVSIAKKYVRHADAFDDLISDGNLSLMKAIEKFDYMRGFKFSTYATWAIKNNFARMFAVEAKHLDRFRHSQDELLDQTAEQRANPYESENAQLRCESAVAKVLDCLNERERGIIKKRFGLNGCERPHTLKEVGEELGVSKERVRQIESRALDKLREAASVEKIETPAT